MREFLSQKNVEFEDRNIRYDPQAKQEVIDMFGAEVVPLTIINGQMVVGFDQEKLEALLAGLDHE